MMQELSRPQFLDRTGDRLRELFGESFNSDKPFTEALPRRAILYPTSYSLSDHQMQALAHAAAAQRDTRAFLWFVEVEPAYWQFDLQQTNTWHPAWRKGWESVLFGALGSWAVFQSQDQLSILGGHDDFIEAFARKYPELRAGELEYLRAASVDASLTPDLREPIEEFLRYVYGEDGPLSSVRY